LNPSYADDDDEDDDDNDDDNDVCGGSVSCGTSRRLKLLVSSKFTAIWFCLWRGIATAASSLRRHVTVTSGSSSLVLDPSSPYEVHNFVYYADASDKQW